MNKSSDMTKGSPTGLLISFSIPVLFGLIFQQIYTAADTAIVSKTLGTDALAAVGCLNSVNFLILGFITGMGSGLSIPISQAFGARDDVRLKKLTGNMIWIAAALSAVFTAASVILCRTILNVTNTPENIYDMAYIYMVTMFWGIPVRCAYNALAGLMRAIGDSRTPLFILVLCSVLNVILDLLFITVFNMGIFGAAFATVISEAVSVAGCFLIIAKKHAVLHIGKSDLKPERECMSLLMKNGLPMGLQVSICGIGSIILQSSINTLGSSSVAAITASERICNILQSVTSSLGTSMSVYCGQNLGAGNISRVRRGVKSGTIIGLSFSLIALGVIALFGRNLITIFVDTAEAELIELTFRCLIITGCFLWGQGIIATVRFSIQGLGFSNIALIAAILEMIARGGIGLFIVPKFGFTGACFSNPIAWVFADFVIIPAYFILIKKLQQTNTRNEA